MTAGGSCFLGLVAKLDSRWTLESSRDNRVVVWWCTDLERGATSRVIQATVNTANGRSFLMIKWGDTNDVCLLSRTPQERMLIEMPMKCKMRMSRKYFLGISNTSR